MNKCLTESGIDPDLKIQTHQRYAFARVNQTNHQLIDRGANGGLAGADMRVLHTTPRKINIIGIDDHEMTGLNVVTAATLLDTQKGPIIGVFHEYAHLGKAGLFMLLVKWNGSTAKLMTDLNMLVVPKTFRHLKAM